MLVNFGKIWAFWAILGILANSGQFGQIWAFWENLDILGKSGHLGQFWSFWANLGITRIFWQKKGVKYAIWEHLTPATGHPPNLGQLTQIFLFLLCFLFSFFWGGGFPKGHCVMCMLDRYSHIGDMFKWILRCNALHYT